MSWNRWTARVLGGVLALTALGGCKQQLFMEPQDYTDAIRPTNLPKNIETNPHDAITPGGVDPVRDPATVVDPDRPARYMTLRECIAIAMEQGNVGSQAVQNFGFRNELVASFNGRSVGGVDSIRAFALDPAVSGADIERSLSKFDARWITSMSWQKVDQPVAAQFLNFQQQRDVANFTSTLAKPLPTGGVAGITFSVDYSKFGQIPQSQAQNFVNPNYTPRLQFVFEQPLLQLFGVEINQLTNQSPTSTLIQGLRPSGGQTTEGILLTRIRFDQSQAEFCRVVNHLLVNIETAYWNLYASYYNLYGQEEGLRQSFDGWRFTKARVEAGTDPPQQLNQARAQLEFFRVNVYRARGQVLESERQLRSFMGLRSDDGYRLVPIDEPNVVPYRPDFYEAANDAIAFRPELMLVRQDLKATQLNLLLQRNLRRPDLRFFSSYDVAGLGTRLDGPEFIPTNTGGTIQGNAWSNLANNQFNSWTLGLRLDMPLGFRDANAAVRQAHLALQRSYYQLRNAELQGLEYVTLQYRRVAETYAVIPNLRERREQLQIYVEKTKQVIQIGRWTSQDFFNYLQVQRDLADAISQEFSAIAQYNSALAQLEFAKGTIQRYNNISVNEGPLPPHVGKRAADHIKERTEAALTLRLRQSPDAPGTGTHGVGPGVGTPFIGELPPLVDTTRMPVPDALPDPRPVPPTGEPKKDEPKKIPTGPITGSPAGRPYSPAAGGMSPTRPPAAPIPPEAYFEPTVPVSTDRHPTRSTGLAPRGSSGAASPPGGLAVPPPTELPPIGTPGLPPLPAIPAPPGNGGIPTTLPGGPGG
jgi:outer membrane protein TolC